MAAPIEVEEVTGLLAPKANVSYLASTSVQFWVGTVIGGAMTGLIGAVLATYTALGMTPAKKLIEAASDYAVEIIKTPATSIGQAEERRDKLVRLRGKLPDIDFGSVIRSAEEITGKELNVLKERKLLEDANVAQGKRDESSRKSHLDEERRASDQRAAVEKARQDEANRLAAIEDEKRRSATAIANEIAQGKVFDELLQRQSSKSK